MINILLWCTLSLIPIINAQQTQYVYEQPFQPQNNYPQQQQYHPQPLQSQQQQQQQLVQHPQYNNYVAEPSQQHHQQYVQPQQQQQHYPVPNNVGPSQDPYTQNQPIPMFQAMPSTSPVQMQQQPLASSSSNSNNGGFMQRMGFSQPPQPHSNRKHMQGMPMNPHEFSGRRGPPPPPPHAHEKRRGKPPMKPRYGKKRPSAGMGPPIKMMDMNRIPKPPKYPLYDMGSLSMATPPPPPVMHPMAQMPSNQYATFVKSPRDGRHPPPSRGGKPPRRRGPPPKKNMRGKPPRPSGRHPPGNHLPRPRGKPPHPQDKKHAVSHGFDHPMTSNMDPLIDSPSLGRPLSYDEYMERPSHSFTNDPWNFDPFAAKYNSGMNTYAMKYNYDPLGMNSLDKSQSHLDPNKLSYPGDYYTQDTSLTPGVDSNPHGVKSSQIGGWDQSPDTYRVPEKDLLPPVVKTGGGGKGHNRNQQHETHRTAPSQNSFNMYEDNVDESSVVNAETVNPLKLLSDANPGIEFSIENADGSDTDLHGAGSSINNNNYQQTQYYSDQLHNTEPVLNENPWNAYPISQQPYQDSGTAYTEHSFRTDDVMFEQPQASQQTYNHHAPPQPQSQNYYNQPSLNNYQAASTTYSQQQLPPLNQYPHQSSPSRHDYENAPSPYTYDDDVQANNRKQDYVVHEAPYSNLSDHYSPGAPDGLNTEILPPHENAPVFKRTGARLTRHENTPMIELDGISLLRDILNNHNAIGARKQLFQALN